MKSAALRALQCKRNIQEILIQGYNLIPPKVVGTRTDRTIFLADESFMHDFLIHVPADFSEWNAVSGHQVEEALAAGTKAECGWQENVIRFSLQLIKYKDKIDGKYLLEGDVDYWNKNAGLAPLAAHGGEVGYNKLRRFIGLLIQKKIPYKTNPFTVMNGIGKRGISVEDVRKDYL